MRTITSRTIRPMLGLLLCTLATASCGSVVRQGRGSSYLIIDSLAAAAGVKPEAFGDVLQSDVITAVKMTIDSEEVRVPTVFEDVGRVTLRLAMKDVTGTGPTTNNEITITRYHVRYARSDGRNGQGVDVPYEFDGAVTATVAGSGPTTLTFVIVRAQAKKEAPLAALAGGGGAFVISSIAEVTFYGHDQAGNSVSVTGTISINFADWGDPQ